MHTNIYHTYYQVCGDNECGDKTTIHRIATTTVRVRFAQQHLRPVAETGFSPSAAPVT